MILLVSCLYLLGAQGKTIRVTTTDDHGKGSLRQALIAANESCEATEITFNLGDNDRGYDNRRKCWVFTVQKPLPSITSEVHIDGYTQKSSYPNTQPMDKPNDATILIELCGASNELNGLHFAHGSANSSLSGVALCSFSTAITVESADVHIHGCFLGVDAKGRKAKNTIVSIYITPDAEGVSLGGGYPDERNLIAGDGKIYDTDIWGAITNFGKDTTIQGTTINLSKDGTSALSSSAAIGIFSCLCNGTVIGGSELNQRVVSSGHCKANILFDTTCSDTLCNVFAGTDITGTKAIGGKHGLVFVHTKSGETFSHTVKDCLFSAHRKNGVILGKIGDSQRIIDAYFERVKAGSDMTGTMNLGNGNYGFYLRYAQNTFMDDICSNFNKIAGVYHGLKSFGTRIPTLEICYNELNGITIEGEIRPIDEFEGQMTNTRITGNGNNAVTTPCGIVRTLDQKKDER